MVDKPLKNILIENLKDILQMWTSFFISMDVIFSYLYKNWQNRAVY